MKNAIDSSNKINNNRREKTNYQSDKERFGVFFNNFHDAAFVNFLGPEFEFGNFIEVNDSACLQLGFTRAELMRFTISELVQEYDRRILEKARSQLQIRPDFVFEVDLVRKDKRRIPVEVSSRVFEFEDRLTMLSVARNITERKLIEKKLIHTGNQLRDLASRLQTIREEERAMIAREIHDELGQVLTVLKIQVTLLAGKLPLHEAGNKEKIKQVSRMFDQMVETVQKITAKLRPGILDELGLLAAIEWQAQEFENTTGIRCDLTLPENELKLDSERSTALFRIFQEALTNVARHAHANKISVILRVDAGKLIMEITDNGFGIRESQIGNPKSLGILGMKERVLVLGGILTIHGVPGKGTNIKIELPAQLEEI